MTHAGDTSRCGACGYSTQGLASLICPECGSDFRRVGIVTPDRTRRRAPGLRFIGGSIIYGLVVLAIGNMLNDVLPRLVPMPRTYRESRSYSQWLLPRTFEIIGEARTWSDVRPRLSVRIEMFQRGQQAPVVWMLPNDGPTEQQVEAWLRDYSVPESPGAIAAAAKAIVRLVEDVRRPTQLLAHGATSASFLERLERTGSASRPSWHLVERPLNILWSLIFIVGVIFLWRHRARRPFTSAPADG